MDILADVLKQAGLKKRILFQRTFSQAMAMTFPCSKSFGFHVVTQGSAYAHLKKNQIVPLKKGDIIMIARGYDHVISTENKLSQKLLQVPTHDSLPSPAEPGSSQSTIKLNLISGAYQFWNDPVHPFFNELPEWFLLKSEDIESYDQLQTTINLLSQEVRDAQLGTDAVVQNLLDVLFYFIIRRIVKNNSGQLKTWSHALQDQQIRQALEIMHSQCAYEWTLDELAKKVGLSRAGFAQKFKKTLGETPLQYLTLIRVQKSMELLSNTQDNLEKIAESIGYKDAFSFSKVFKKITGVPPKQFRQKDLSEKNISWRY